jgi:formylglycine-generating enzyme required for sulfatase activity
MKMLGKKKSNLIVGNLSRLLACVLLLGFTMDVAKSQVVIVQSKQLRSSKSTNKNKSKSKPKPSTAAAPIASPTPISNFALPLDTSLEASPRRMAFVVKRPELHPISISIDNNLGNEKPEINDNPVVTDVSNMLTPKLLGYEFEVVTADDRGRIAGRRTESARYYYEELSGGVQLDMVEIPGGTFMMGSVATEVEGLKKEYVKGIEREIKDALLKRLQWEAPQHMVKIPAFYLGKFEVTQAQWRAVASLPKVNRDLVSDPSHFKGGNRPVDKISWDDAIEFCERLSRATGRRYRLPTEAEWEYACRAGTNTPFNFGDSIKTEWANYHGKHTYASSPKGAYREQTVVVGSLGIGNAFGLYDMHGNVWEWCSDTWHDSYNAAPEDGKAWQNGEIQYLKIIRGGSWDSAAGECRSNARNRMTSSIQLNSIGFRVVAEAPSQQVANEASITLK